MFDAFGDFGALMYTGQCLTSVYRLRCRHIVIGDRTKWLLLHRLCKILQGDFMLGFIAVDNDFDIFVGIVELG